MKIRLDSRLVTTATKSVPPRPAVVGQVQPRFSGAMGVTQQRYSANGCHETHSRHPSSLAISSNQLHYWCIFVTVRLPYSAL